MLNDLLPTRVEDEKNKGGKGTENPAWPNNNNDKILVVIIVTIIII